MSRREFIVSAAKVSSAACLLSIFEGSGFMKDILGHESLHSAGLEDQYGNDKFKKFKAYRFSEPPNLGAYEEIKGTPAALINPDSIMSEVYP